MAKISGEKEGASKKEKEGRELNEFLVDSFIISINGTYFQGKWLMIRLV